jgi:hypothetical protein
MTNFEILVQEAVRQQHRSRLKKKLQDCDKETELLILQRQKLKLSNRINNTYQPLPKDRSKFQYVTKCINKILNK